MWVSPSFQCWALVAGLAKMQPASLAQPCIAQQPGSAPQPRQEETLGEVSPEITW